MQFFSDDRCKFDKGHIQVQTQYPFYEPGGTIFGKVYMNINQPVEAKYLELEVKGGEKASFIRFWQE